MTAASGMLVAAALPAWATPQHDKVTLCHATGSATNPYVAITVSAAGAHNGHYSQHADHGRGDIIPPFEFNGQTYSLHWDAEHRAIFDAGCQAPTDHGDNQPGNPGNGNPGHGNPGGGKPGTDNPGGAPGNGNPGDNPDRDAKVTLCHATGSASNPYVRITVAAAGAYNGHYSQHEDLGDGDVIPPFTFQGATYSLNWDADGQALFANGCEKPTAGTPGDGNPGDNPGGGNPGDNPGGGNPGGGNPGGEQPGADNPGLGVGSAPKPAAPVGATSGAALSAAGETGPIPGAADAGRHPVEQWQLLAGAGLALAGALGGATVWYRRTSRVL